MHMVIKTKFTSWQPSLPRRLALFFSKKKNSTSVSGAPGKEGCSLLTGILGTSVCQVFGLLASEKVPHGLPVVTYAYVSAESANICGHILWTSHTVGLMFCSACLPQNLWADVECS